MPIKFSPRNFSRTEDGSLTVEAVLVIPILFFAIAATLVTWDAFKTRNISQKATYTVADMLARETTGVDEDYLTAAHELFGYLANSGTNALRVTVVDMTEDPDTKQKSLNLVWSRTVGGLPEFDNAAQVQNRVPRMAVGDQIVLVESVQGWSPAFSMGLGDYTFREIAVMRPRFSPQLVWTGGPPQKSIGMGEQAETAS